MKLRSRITFALTAVTASAQAQLTYKLHDFGPFNGPGLVTTRSLNDFNNLHQAIGTILSDEGSKGAFGLNFATPPSKIPITGSLNNRGDMTGIDFVFSGGLQYAAVVIDGDFRRIGDVGSAGIEINDSQNVLLKVGGGSSLAFWTWNHQSTLMTPVVAPASAKPTRATAFNNQGRVAGAYRPSGSDSSAPERGFVWDAAGGATDIALPSGFKGFVPARMNDSGWVAGIARTNANMYQAMLVRADGSTVLLGTPVSQASSLSNLAINNWNQVLFQQHSVIFSWNPVDGLQPFQPTLDPATLDPGYTYSTTNTSWISDDGWLCGGVRATPLNPFLPTLTLMSIFEPVPAPGTITLAALAIGLGCKRKRIARTYPASGRVFSHSATTTLHEK